MVQTGKVEPTTRAGTHGLTPYCDEIVTAFCSCHVDIGNGSPDWTKFEPSVSRWPDSEGMTQSTRFKRRPVSVLEFLDLNLLQRSTARWR